MKKIVKIVITIICMIIVCFIGLIIKKGIIINKCASFTFEKISSLEQFSIQELRFDINDKNYNTIEIYKYADNWHYIINDSDIYFTSNSNEMTVINNGNETIQGKVELNNNIQLFNTYFNENASNFIDKLKFIFSSKVTSAMYNEISVYVISVNNVSWYINKENNVPVYVKDLFFTSEFEFSETVEKNQAIL